MTQLRSPCKTKKMMMKVGVMMVMAGMMKK